MVSRDSFEHAGHPQMTRFDPLAGDARSALMAKVRGRGNASTEALVASLLRKHRIAGWRRHAALPGSPDFYFRDHRLALFIHGCFWHGCPRCYRPPKGNKPFWTDKLSDNRRRDARVLRRLRVLGYSTMTIWEHELKDDNWVRRLRARLARVAKG